MSDISKCSRLPLLLLAKSIRWNDCTFSQHPHSVHCLDKSQHGHFSLSIIVSIIFIFCCKLLAQYHHFATLFTAIVCSFHSSFCSLTVMATCEMFVLQRKMFAQLLRSKGGQNMPSAILLDMQNRNTNCTMQTATST